MPDNTDDNGNGRVTLAIIGTKLDNIADRLEDICSRADGHDYRLRTLENGQVARQEQIAFIKDDVSNLKRKYESWSLLNSVGAGIAAILGGIGFTR